MIFDVAEEPGQLTEVAILQKEQKSDKHFFRKKEHTRIKHSIFAETLRKSLSIANMLVPAFSKGKPQTYTYIDLFAGPGKFQDEEKGSPLLAFQIFKEHLCATGSVKNAFSKIKMFAFEETETDADGLRNLLNEELLKSGCNDRIEVSVQGGNWEIQSASIAKLIAESQWGFVFADPFSTELNLVKFIKTIEAGKNLKDIIILSNFRTLGRQARRQHRGDIDRVCKSLGITPQQLETEDPEYVFKNALQQKFGNLKQFTIGVAIPIEVEGKLHSADYFYLLCATDSVKVADNFLEAYEKEVDHIKETAKKSNQLPLPYECDPIFRELDHEVYYSLKFHLQSKSNLYQLIIKMFNDFLSWKTAIANPFYKVPTIKNIVDSVNILRQKKKVILSGDEKYFYKKKRQDHMEGDLKYSEIHNRRDTQAVTLKAIDD